MLDQSFTSVATKSALSLMPHYILYQAPKAQTRAQAVRAMLQYNQCAFDTEVVDEHRWVDFQVLEPQCYSLPALSVDGKCLSHSRAICRYLAKIYGQNGANNGESYECDVIVQRIHNVDQQWHTCALEMDEELKSHLWSTLQREHLMPFFEYLEDILNMRNDQKMILVGQAITWADIYVFALVQNWLVEYPMLISSQNQLQRFMSGMSSIEAFKGLSGTDDLGEESQLEMAPPTPPSQPRPDTPQYNEQETLILQATEHAQEQTPDEDKPAIEPMVQTQAVVDSAAPTQEKEGSWSEADEGIEVANTAKDDALGQKAHAESVNSWDQDK